MSSCGADAADERRARAREECGVATCDVSRELDVHCEGGASDTLIPCSCSNGAGFYAPPAYCADPANAQGVQDACGDPPQRCTEARLAAAVAACGITSCEIADRPDVICHDELGTESVVTCTCPNDMEFQLPPGCVGADFAEGIAHACGEL